MEDLILKLKSSKTAKILGGIFLLLIFTAVTWAYSPFYTHPDLTQQMAELFNRATSIPDDRITPDQIEWLRQGALEEDEPPRWINHFYDPVHGTGWSGKHAGTLSQAEGLKQGAELTPLAPMASLFWVTNQPAQSAYRQFGNQTWQKALWSYLAGDKRQAFVALGHVLHLAEDASVPDHTRDDTHNHLNEDPGSPFEDYAEKYTNTHSLTLANELSIAAIPAFSSIQAAFLEIANYSNHNFFSEDTISNEEFNFPNLKTLQEKDNYLYDAVNNIYVARFEKEGNKYFYTTSDRDKVLPSYRDHIFPKVILTGAGVIKLFFSEVAKYSQRPDWLEPLETDRPISWWQSFINSPWGTVKLPLVVFKQNVVDRLVADSERAAALTEFLKTPPAPPPLVFFPFKPTTGTISIPLPKPVPLQWIAQSQLPAARAAGGGTLSNSLAQSQTLFVSESRADASKNNLTTASDLTHPYPAQAGTATGVPSSFAQVSLDRLVPTAVEDHRFLGIGTGGETKKPSSNTATTAALLGAAVLGVLAVAVRPRVINSNSATRPALFSPPQPNYAKNIFYQPEDTIQYGAGSKPPGNNVTWRPPNGQPGDAGRWILTIPGFYFSNLNGVYRQITDFQNSGIDPATIQPGRFGGDPNSARPVTAGGAQSWEQYKNGAYAMDPEIREAVDEMNNFQSALSPLPLSPASEFVRHYWPVQFRPDLTNAQQESIRHMLDTRMNENAVLNEIDAKNFAYATNQSDWQKLVGKKPVELF